LFEYVTGSLFASDPWYVALVFGLIPVSAAIGLARLSRMGLEVQLLLVATITAPLLMFLHHRFVLHSVLLFWYMIFFLPTLIALVGVGLDGLGRGLAGRAAGMPRAVGIAMGLTVAGLFFWIYIVQTLPGKKGRNAQMRGDDRPYVSYKRGHYHWVVYQNGYSIRVHEDNTIPEEFGPQREAEAGGGK